MTGWRTLVGTLVVSVACCAGIGSAQPATQSAAQAMAAAKRIPAGSKVYIAPMGGFQTYLAAALTKKNVPVLVVAKKSEADFEISGKSHSHRPGWARTIFFGQVRSDEQASITVTNLKTGVVAWAYEVNKQDAFRGLQSAAEACAKHLKNKIEGKER